MANSKKQDGLSKHLTQSQDNTHRIRETDRAILALLRRAERKRKNTKELPKNKTSFTEEFFASIEID